MEEVNDILIGKDGVAGTIILNRPRARNALNTGMRAKIAEALPRWARDPDVYAIIVASASDLAFCAGGDLREMVDWGRSRPAEAHASLAAEYSLNWRMECLTKPTISLIDGIVVGSGVGISLYGTHRVAGERYRFAMPEIGIGLFPDCGVCHAFARLPDCIGMYLALTGRAIGRADAYHLGLVTHCIAAHHFNDIRAAIREADPVDPILDSRHDDPGPAELEARREAIARCFSADSVEEILARLAAENGSDAEWAREVIADLERGCPTSQKVTHRHVREARELDLRGTLVQDYRVARRCLERNDFYEGVRAAVVDKDRAPNWRPQRLEDATEGMVGAHFATLGGEELQLPSRSEMQAVQP